MLLFIDESGHHDSGTPYEVLAGVAVSEDNLWNLVKAVRSAEKEHFGGYLRNLLSGETKGRKLLKTKRFKLANKAMRIKTEDLPMLANALLVKGRAAHEQGLADSGGTMAEMVAYSRQVLSFVHTVLDIAASFSVQVFATMVDQKAPKPPTGVLRKDYVYLFERYFYFLETLPPRARGLVVFDELEKSQAHGLLQQMALLSRNADRTVPEFEDCARAVFRSFGPYDWRVPGRPDRLYSRLGMAIAEDGGAGASGASAVRVKAARYAVPRREAETGGDRILATPRNHAHR